MRDAYEVQLRDVTVVMRLLTPGEVLQAMKAGGESGTAQNSELLAMSIVEVDGQQVRYADLADGGLKRHLPRTRHYMSAVRAWTQVHQPTEAQIDAVLDSTEPELDGDGERWTATLPDGRAVTLRELEPGSVENALKQAQKSAKSKSAAEWAGTIETLRAAVHTVNGEPVDTDNWDALFSVRETWLLKAVLSEMLALDDEIVVGEVKPGSGT